VHGGPELTAQDGGVMPRKENTAAARIQAGHALMSEGGAHWSGVLRSLKEWDDWCQAVKEAAPWSDNPIYGERLEDNFPHVLGAILFASGTQSEGLNDEEQKHVAMALRKPPIRHLMTAIATLPDPDPELIARYQENNQRYRNIVRANEPRRRSPATTTTAIKEEYRRCGKKNCKCYGPDGTLHGPYRYKFSGGRREYVGK